MIECIERSCQKALFCQDRDFPAKSLLEKS